MSDQAYTYRSDLRYVQTETMGEGPFGNQMMMTRERVVGPWRWIFYRVQFWRFEKSRSFNVLREKRLDAWMRSKA